MRLPGHDRRALARIDQALTRHDPALAAMFGTFTRLTKDDGSPPAERPATRWNKVLATVLLPVVLVSGVVAAKYSGRSASAPHCGRTVAAACAMPWRGGFAWARGNCSAPGGQRPAAAAAPHC